MKDHVRALTKIKRVYEHSITLEAEVSVCIFWLLIFMHFYATRYATIVNCSLEKSHYSSFIFYGTSCMEEIY